MAAALGLVLAMPAATWWLVGDLSTVSVTDRSYAFRPWPIRPAVAHAAGAGSLAVGTVAAAVLGWATARRVLDVRWWAVLGPLVAAGFIAGAGWRVMTAGVYGANFGAGLVIFLGGPIVLVLLVGAVVCAAYLLSRADHAKVPPINPGSN